jgi:hypothetical protein
MFHFPTFPPLTLCVQVRVTGHDSCRVSPFGNPRITARLTAPRGLSQPPTSFIGSWCLGIHRVPLITWPQRCSRPLCSSQGTGGPGAGPTAYPARRAVRVETPVLSAPQPPTPATRASPEVPVGSKVRGLRPFPQDPTACSTTPPPTDPVFHTPGGAVLTSCGRPGRTGQRSTHEHQQGLNIPDMALDAHPEGMRASCSLERR